MEKIFEFEFSAYSAQQAAYVWRALDAQGPVFQVRTEDSVDLAFALVEAVELFPFIENYLHSDQRDFLPKARALEVWEIIRQEMEHAKVHLLERIRAKRFDNSLEYDFVFNEDIGYGGYGAQIQYEPSPFVLKKLEKLFKPYPADIVEIIRSGDSFIVRQTYTKKTEEEL